MLIYVDLPMKTGIFEAQQRIIQADSDLRLHSYRLCLQGFGGAGVRNGHQNGHLIYYSVRTSEQLGLTRPELAKFPEAV